MSRLAETANRYLEYASTHIEDDPHVQLGAEASSSPKMDYAREARLVQESFQEMLVTLLCDSENAVRRGLVHNGLAKLCVFFGKQKSSDVLLSHMITFLNDKNDWRLRATFYDCCPALAAFIGWQSSTVILKPLLQQGLRDSEEIVVFKTLSSLAVLTRSGLIQKPTIYELLQDAVPFLAHPDGAIRIGCVALFCSAAKFLNLADVHCKVMPMIGPYLKQPLIKLDREHVVYKALKVRSVIILGKVFKGGMAHVSGSDTKASVGPRCTSISATRVVGILARKAMASWRSSTGYRNDVDDDVSGRPSFGGVLSKVTDPRVDG